MCREFNHQRLGNILGRGDSYDICIYNDSLQVYPHDKGAKYLMVVLIHYSRFTY